MLIKITVKIVQLILTGQLDPFRLHKTIVALPLPFWRRGAINYLIQCAELLSVLMIKFTKLFESYNAIFHTIHFYIYHTQKTQLWSSSSVITQTRLICRSLIQKYSTNHFMWHTHVTKYEVLNETNCLMLTFIAVRKYAKHEYVTKCHWNFKEFFTWLSNISKLKNEKQERRYNPSLAN